MHFIVNVRVYGFICRQNSLSAPYANLYIKVFFKNLAEGNILHVTPAEKALVI